MNKQPTPMERLSFVANIYCLFARLLWEKNSVDVGKDTTSSDGNTSKQLVQFLIVLNGKGDVTGYDTSLLVITGGVTGKFQDLST